MGNSIWAIVQRGGIFKAAHLRRTDDGLELLACRNATADQTDWQSFCQSLSAAPSADVSSPAAASSSADDLRTVIGFDAGGIVFYRASVPTVKPDQLDAIARLQAEALLPLSADQMEIVWRAEPPRDGKTQIILAAGRADQLHRFARTVEPCRPEKILLDCHGTVGAWQLLFGGGPHAAVIIHIGPDSTRICLTQRGRLTLAVTADVRADQLTSDGQLDRPHAEQLAQDTRGALELFCDSDTAPPKAFVLADDPTTAHHVAEYLAGVGLDVAPCALRPEPLARHNTLSDEQIYQYALPIGLAAVALEDHGAELALFDKIHRTGRPGRRLIRPYSLKLAGSLAALMLVALIAVWYAADVGRLNRYQTLWQTLEDDLDVTDLTRQRDLRRQIARQRPDMLDLYRQINAARPKGMMLDGIDFKIGRPVSITGIAKDRDQLFAFQESLQQQKGLTAVRIQSSNPDEKGKKLTYTITCGYKTFSKKASPLAKESP